MMIIMIQKLIIHNNDTKINDYNVFMNNCYLHKKSLKSLAFFHATFHSFPM